MSNNKYEVLLDETSYSSTLHGVGPIASESLA